MELIIICLWDVEKCSKNTTINLFWRRNMRYAAPLLWASSEVLIFWKNSRCSTPNNFYSLNCQAVILRPTKILLGLVFTVDASKTRSEQKCIFDSVKFISVTILKHGLTTKQQTRFGKTEIIWTSSTTINYHHLF